MLFPPAPLKIAQLTFCSLYFAGFWLIIADLGLALTSAYRCGKWITQLEHQDTSPPLFLVLAQPGKQDVLAVDLQVVSSIPLGKRAA